MFSKLTLFILLIVTPGAFAAIQGFDMLSYSSWKERQIVKAQNRVVQIANQLLMAESAEYQIVEVPASWPEVFKRSTNPEDNKMSLSEAKQALKQAKDNLQATKELGFEDYVEVYLQLTKDDPESLKKWLAKLTTDETAQLVTHVYKSKRGEGFGARRTDFKESKEKEEGELVDDKISSNIKELDETTKK